MFISINFDFQMSYFKKRCHKAIEGIDILRNGSTWDVNIVRFFMFQESTWRIQTAFKSLGRVRFEGNIHQLNCHLYWRPSRLILGRLFDGALLDMQERSGHVGTGQSGSQRTHSEILIQLVFESQSLPLLQRLISIQSYSIIVLL